MSEESVTNDPTLLFVDESVWSRSTRGNRNKSEDALFQGKLTLHCNHNRSHFFIRWKALNAEIDDWLIEKEELSSLKNTQESHKEQRHAHLTLILHDGSHASCLVFDDPEHRQGFLDVLRQLCILRQSRTDPRLLIVVDSSQHALDMTISQLNLFDNNENGPAENDDYSGHGGHVWKLVEDVAKDPYLTALTTFSKITDRLLYNNYSTLSSTMNPFNEYSDEENNPGYVPSCSLALNDESEPFEVINSSPALPMTNLLSMLPEVHRLGPLTASELLAFEDPQGRIDRRDDFLDRIFRGGIEADLRSRLWKLVLNVHNFDDTHVQREEKRKCQVETYFRLKQQWKSIDDDQISRFTAFRERQLQVSKDVTRTDRCEQFFAGDDNANVEMLRDVLMTYVMYNFDLGYVQGMSDLLSPILKVMDNEVDAFFAFVAFMDRVEANFGLDQRGMKLQLSQLVTLLKVVDGGFYSYLVSADSGNLFFLFRWLLIWFKREFTLDQVMRLWEVLWTQRPCRNFHLLICVAMLTQHKSAMVENRFTFNEILKYINDLAYNIELNPVLERAEAIFLRLKQLDYVTPEVRAILDPLHDGESHHNSDENIGHVDENLSCQ